jgi:hypothetical protein
MLFNNPEIIKSSADSRIGGVDLDENNIDFDNYILAVKIRIAKLLYDFVEEQMSGGAMTREQAIEEARGQVYNYIHIVNKNFSDNEFELAEEIMQSEEFSDWKVKIFYRFQDMHHLNIGNPVPVNVAQNEKMEEVMDEQENLFTILEGLVAQYK